MQTAIDWYFDKIKSHFEHDGDLLETATFTYAIAKQKEKQQIIDAWWNGHDTRDNSLIHPSEDCNGYYNETYGSKGSDEKKINLIEIPKEQIEKERNPNYKYFDIDKPTSSQTKISDEEIEKKAEDYAHNHFNMHETNTYVALKQGFLACAKWYREQLKKKQ